MNQVSAQVVASAIIVWLLQFAKKSSRLPWISDKTGTLNRTIAVIASLCTSLGVHFSWSAAEGVLVISGLTVAGLAHFAGHWLVSFVSQQLIYQNTVQQPTIPAELAAALGEWVRQQQGLPSSRDLDQVTAENSLAKGAS